MATPSALEKTLLAVDLLGDSMGPEDAAYQFDSEVVDSEGGTAIKVED